MIDREHNPRLALQTVPPLTNHASAKRCPEQLEQFEGEHSGLFLLEAECESAEALDEFVAPVFAGVEVTGDPRFNGGNLAANGLPVAA